MPATSISPETSPKRRAPSQRRSRERVERILDAASELIVADGVDTLGTRKIADHAEVPVASIYQYFSDKEEIILELVKRDVAEMDKRVASSLAALDVLSVRSIVTTTMRAYTEVYALRPAFIAIWLRGRTNLAVMAFCRDHNRRTAKTLHALMMNLGLLTPEADVTRGELAVELGDRVFQLAYEKDFRGDQRIIDDGREIVIDYLERFATDAGRAGVRAPTATGA